MNIVNDVLARYRQCVEYFDSISDPVKYYFMEKIQYVLADQKTISLLVNGNSEFNSNQVF